MLFLSLSLRVDLLIILNIFFSFCHLFFFLLHIAVSFQHALSWVLLNVHLILTNSWISSSFHLMLTAITFITLRNVLYLIKKTLGPSKILQIPYSKVMSFLRNFSRQSKLFLNPPRRTTILVPHSREYGNSVYLCLLSMQKACREVARTSGMITSFPIPLQNLVVLSN